MHFQVLCHPAKSALEGPTEDNSHLVKISTGTKSEDCCHSSSEAYTNWEGGKRFAQAIPVVMMMWLLITEWSFLGLKYTSRYTVALRIRIIILAPTDQCGTVQV